MTSMSFPIPADSKVQNIINELTASGVDNYIIESIKSTFEQGVRKGVQNAFLYNYITQEAIVNEVKMLHDQEEISQDVVFNIYSMTEQEIITVLSNDEYDWERFQHALESQSTVDLNDIYDEALSYAVDILINHVIA